MTYGNINDMASARIRAVMAAQNIPVAKVAEVWHQSVDMASRRINGTVELKLGEIDASAASCVTGCISRSTRPGTSSTSERSR